MSLLNLVLAAAGAAATLAALEASAQPAKNPVAVLDTTLGSITIELNPAAAPLTVKNFVSYVESGHYDGLIFHRVIPNFMVQGGGLASDMSQKKTSAPIKNEADNGLKNDRGTIAMARTSVVDSATSQFFINLKNNDFLNHRERSSQGFGYAVFGKVTAGMEVVDRIAGVATTTRVGQKDVPVDPIVIKSAKVKKD